MHEARHRPRAGQGPLHDIEEEGDGTSGDTSGALGYDVVGLASKAPYVSMGDDDRFDPDEYWNSCGGEQEPNPDMPGRSPRRKVPLISIKFIFVSTIRASFHSIWQL